MCLRDRGAIERRSPATAAAQAWLRAPIGLQMTRGGLPPPSAGMRYEAAATFSLRRVVHHCMPKVTAINAKKKSATLLSTKPW